MKQCEGCNKQVPDFIEYCSEACYKEDMVPFEEVKD